MQELTDMHHAIYDKVVSGPELNDSSADVHTLNVPDILSGFVSPDEFPAPGDLHVVVNPYTGQLN